MVRRHPLCRAIGHLLLLRLIESGRIPAPAPQIVFLTPAQAKAAL